MCGARMYRGAPKAHSLLIVFLALNVFLWVFSMSGAAGELLRTFGQNTKGVRIAGGTIPIILAVLGVNLCLIVSRTQLSKKQQTLYCTLITSFCWGVYFLYIFSLAAEQTSPRRYTDAGSRENLPMCARNALLF